MAKRKFLKVVEDEHEVLSKTLSIIPFVLEFTVYAIHNEESDDLYFAGFAINLFTLLEFRLFIPRSESRQSRKAIKDLHKANSIKAKNASKIKIHVYRNSTNGKCMFIPQDDWYRYHRTLDGFHWLATIDAETEAEALEQIKNIRNTTGFKISEAVLGG